VIAMRERVNKGFSLSRVQAFYMLINGTTAHPAIFSSCFCNRNEVSKKLSYMLRAYYQDFDIISILRYNNEDLLVRSRYLPRRFSHISAISAHF
jgi:hypothetical protein